MGLWSRGLRSVSLDGTPAPCSVRLGFALAGQRRRLSVRGLWLRDRGDCTFGAYDQGSAFGVGSDRVEFDS